MGHLAMIIALQLFWISFALIGAALLVGLSYFSKNRQPFLTFVRGTHPLVGLLISEGCGMALFVPLMVPAFFLEWPFAVLVWLYVLVLLCSIGWLAYSWRTVQTYIFTIWKNRNTSTIVWALGASLVLLTDAIIATKVGGPMASDAYVHMAKIHMLTDGGRFTLADPVLGNGVIESRYHINLVLTLHALAASVLHISAIDAWRYSIAFWRFLLWISIFALSWEFVGKKVRERWSYTVLMTTPVLCSTLFFCADYPDRAVFAWIVLLIVGVKLLLEKRSAVLLLLAALLATATHPLMSVIALGFLALVAIVLGVLHLERRWQAKVLLGAMVILSLSVILTYAYPNRMSDSVTNLVLQLQLKHFGPVTLGWPINADPHTWWIWFPLLALGLVGYIYLVKQARSLALKIVLSLLFLYYGLIVYNPILLAIVGNHVPLWVLNRFQEMNVFRLTISVIGALAVLDWLAVRFKHAWFVPLATLAVILGFFWYGSPALRNFIHMNQDFDQDYSQYMLLKSLTPELQTQRIFTNLAFQQQQIPVVVRTNVFNIADQNASPMANMERRQRCALGQLSVSLATSDLRTAGITRVMADTVTDPAFNDLAAHNPDLHLLKRAGPYAVYAVTPGVIDINHKNQCYISHGQ